MKLKGEPVPCGQGPCLGPELCPLSQVRAGTFVRIRQLTSTPEICHRLREMGFCEDQQVRLVSHHHNVICQVCNMRLGISSQLADSILVEPLRRPPVPA